VIVREPGRTPLYLFVSTEPIEIGRACTGLLLTDPQISRVHLQLHCTDGHVVVTDLGSRNGTRIDATPMTTAHRLQPGRTVTFGSSTVQLLEP
jgi:pSer/pThr/pTyr-binding forkhead associated (FHA) protein